MNLAPPCISDHTLNLTDTSEESQTVSWAYAICCDADEYRVSYRPYNLQTCTAPGPDVLISSWQSGTALSLTNLVRETVYQIKVDTRNIPADDQVDPVEGNSVYVVERKYSISFIQCQT